MSGYSNGSSSKRSKRVLKSFEEIAMCLAENISESANFLSKHEHGEQNVQI